MKLAFLLFEYFPYGGLQRDMVAIATKAMISLFFMMFPSFSLRTFFCYVLCQRLFSRTLAFLCSRFT